VVDVARVDAVQERARVSGVAASADVGERRLPRRVEQVAQPEVRALQGNAVVRSGAGPGPAPGPPFTLRWK
jgi:hypothetical protein